ncbi:MAG: hypothetical protein KDB88_06415 [Flavobacteriales bacterium]|nr:hypothetical protein [Flavobacteriales bacterium]
MDQRAREQFEFLGHRSAVYALAPLPGKGKFLSAGGDGQVIKWDLDRRDRGEVIARVDEAVFMLHVLPKLELLVIGTASGMLHVIDLVQRAEVRAYKVHDRGIYAAAAMREDTLAISAGDGTLSLWRATVKGSLDLYRQLPISDAKLRGVTYLPDLRSLAIADGNGPIHVLEDTDWNEKWTLPGHEGGTLCTAWHPARSVLLSGGKDGHLRLWKLDGQGEASLALPAHRSAIYQVAFDRSGALFATASRDRTVKIWDAIHLEVLHRSERIGHGHTHSVNALIHVDGCWISGGDDGRVQVTMA